MPGEIFISCGQSSPKERKFAEEICSLLTKNNFHPYVAIEAQGIQDVNKGIVNKLKESDYYIFINLKRERLYRKLWLKEYRGSLFTNQELAFVYILEFEHAIFLQQKGVILEGIGKYILSNAKTFEGLEEAIKIIESEIEERGWSPDYSRNLLVQYIRAFPHVPYKDDSLFQHQLRQIYHIGVKNCRSDSVAVNVIAHLIEITPLGSNTFNYVDRTDLKWATQKGYIRNIPPGETVPFDAFALDEQNPQNVYMHSLSDTYPRPPVINQIGRYLLHYQIYSENFPVTEVKIDLNLTGQTATTTAQLSK